jgi:hypothetical protein
MAAREHRHPIPGQPRHPLIRKDDSPPAICPSRLSPGLRRSRGVPAEKATFNLGPGRDEAPCRKQLICASACRRSTFISTVK